jgi:hypothetical protein
MANNHLRYGKTSESRDNSRVMIVMPSAELDAIDQWGVPAGMPSRIAAVRFLLKQGLEAVMAKKTGKQPANLTAGSSP